MSTDTEALGSQENVPLLQKQTRDQEGLKDLKGHVKPLLAAFFISTVTGLNDGSLGTLIPRMKADYGISNETISILFLCWACGLFVSAGLNGFIVHRLGQLRALYLGSTTILIAYIIISTAPPFIVIACTMPLVGAGMALLNAAMNVFVANVPLATLMLSILHGINIEPIF